MKPEKQRIAISESCGAKWVDAYWFGSTIKVLSFEPIPQLGVNRWDTEDDCRKLNSDIPDYLNDLNAMHEAEQVLTGVGRLPAYRRKLACMFTDHPDDGYPHAIHANAAQRAEAFLRTLNLWTE